MQKAVVAWVLLAVGSAAPAWAQRDVSSSSITVVNVGGRCEVLMIAGKPAVCEKIAYMSFPNGRLNFTVPLATGALSISGGKSLQPNLNDFVLLVDRIINSGAQYPARGKCEMSVNDSGSLVHTIACDVETEFGAIQLSFRGNGKPVKIDRIPSP